MKYPLSLPVCFLALPLWCVACNSETGLRSETLSFQAVKPGSSSAKVTHCTVLPQLIGTEIDDDIVLESGVTAHVIATRDDAALTFTGTRDPTVDVRLVSDAQLASGYSDALSVTASASGTSYDISLASKCP